MTEDTLNDDYQWGKLVTKEVLDKKLEKLEKESADYKAMEKFIAKVEAVKKADRKDYDKKLKDMTDKVATFIKASSDVDAKITALDITI